MRAEVINAYPLRCPCFTACSVLRARQSYRLIVPPPGIPYPPSNQRLFCQSSDRYFSRQGGGRQVGGWFCFFLL